MDLRVFLATLGVFALSSVPALPQAFDPGPQGIVTGSSMAGARVGGAPKRALSPRLPNADVFGDEVEERAYGRDYDNSYLKPDVRSPTLDDDRSTEERAGEGRSDLNGINAGTFARQGPTAIGKSSVARPRSGGHAPIIFSRPPKAR